MPRRIQTIREYSLGSSPLLFTGSVGYAEHEYFNVTVRRSFVVSDVSAAIASVPAELTHLWGDRVALRVFGGDNNLDDYLQNLLRRGVDGLCVRSAEEGYEYTEEERTMLLLASQGCGHLYGAQGDIRWNMALSPTVQVWDGATKKRVAQSVALELLRQKSVSVRLIAALRGVAVPYEDGPYFDFEVSAIEIFVTQTPPNIDSVEDRSDEETHASAIRSDDDYTSAPISRENEEGPAGAQKESGDERGECDERHQQDDFEERNDSCDVLTTLLEQQTRLAQQIDLLKTRKK